MKRNKIDRTLSAVTKELAEPGEAAGCAAIRDCGSAELGFSREWLHGTHVRNHGLVDGHARRATVAAVGFVEREQRVGSFVNGLLCVRWPNFQQVWSVIEEKRDERDGWVEDGIVSGIPRVVVVVAPGDLRVLAGE